MRDLNLKNVVNFRHKEYLVSTIATPIRHTWFEDDDRIVYETMVFELKDEDIDYSLPLFNERYHNADEAIAEHSFIIENIEMFLAQEE